VNPLKLNEEGNVTRCAVIGLFSPAAFTVKSPSSPSSSSSSSPRLSSVLTIIVRPLLPALLLRER
jgi:hypothetical protein